MSKGPPSISKALPTNPRAGDVIYIAKPGTFVVSGTHNINGQATFTTRIPDTKLAFWPGDSEMQQGWYEFNE